MSVLSGISLWCSSFGVIPPLARTWLTVITGNRDVTGQAGTV